MQTNAKSKCIDKNKNSNLERKNPRTHRLSLYAFAEPLFICTKSKSVGEQKIIDSGSNIHFPRAFQQKIENIFLKSKACILWQI